MIKRFLSILFMALFAMFIIAINNAFGIELSKEFIIFLKIFYIVCFAFLIVQLFKYINSSTNEELKHKFLCYLGAATFLIITQEFYFNTKIFVNTKMSVRPNLLSIIVKSSLLASAIAFINSQQTKKKMLYFFTITGNLLFFILFFLFSYPVIFQHIENFFFIYILKQDLLSNYFNVFQIYIELSNYFTFFMLILFFIEDFKKKPAYILLMFVICSITKNIISFLNIKIIRFFVNKNMIVSPFFIYLFILIFIYLTLVCISKLFREYDMNKIEIKRQGYIYFFLFFLLYIIF